MYFKLGMCLNTFLEETWKYSTKKSNNFRNILLANASELFVTVANVYSASCNSNGFFLLLIVAFI